MKKGSFSKIVTTLSILFVVLYTIVSMSLQFTCQIEPSPTLTSCVFAVVVVALTSVIGFLNLAKEKRIKKIKEWLLYACTLAEKELGSGTGQVKLRYVYDLFIDKFKFMSMIITFEQFSNLVDNSLDTLREMLKNNKEIKKLVEGSDK